MANPHLGLAAWNPRSQFIEIEDGISFEVFALSGHQIIQMVDTMGAAGQEAFNAVRDAIRDVNPDDMTFEWFRTLSVSIVQRFPKILYGIIAVGAREPEHADKVAELPLPVQLEALDAIVSLTIRSEGELKKLLLSVPRWMEGIRAAMKAVTEISLVPNGPGASESE